MTRFRLLALTAVGLVAVVVVALAVARGRGGSDGDEGAGGGDGSSASAEQSAAAERFLSDYVDRDGRVVRHDEGGDTVSEGQAYALLVATALGDESRFDRVWTWTRANLQRPDGLFAWRWSDGAVSDATPATDADVDIARALAMAGDRFDRAELVDEARRVASAVLEHETAEAGGKLVLVAGPWARDDRIVNPSYLATCGGADLEAVTGDARWARLAADAVDLVDALTEEGLPPDWAVLDDDGQLRPVAGPDEGDGPGRYGLDAARIPARLPACPDGAGVAADLWERLRDLDERGAALAYSLDGELLESARHPVGLIGAAGAARAAGDSGAARELLDRAADLDRDHPTYYGAAWLALGEELLDLGSSADESDTATAVAWGRSVVLPVQQPTTTAPPNTTATTAPPTTAPPTTAPPTTAPPTTAPGPTSPPATSPPATSGGSSPTTVPAPGSPTDTTGETGDSSPGTPGDTGTGPTGTGPNSTRGAGDPTTDGGRAPVGSDSDSGGSGDLSAPADPGAELRDPRGGDDPGELSRRTTGGIALAGVSAAVGLGAVLGLRERGQVLRIRRQRARAASDGA
jgi:endoglucanase